MLGRAKLGWIGLDVPPAALAFLGSNEATYGLREGGAGFHRNRPAAGKTKPTFSAGIVRRVRNADRRWWGTEALRIAEADGRAGAPRSVSNRRARSAEMTA